MSHGAAGSIQVTEEVARRIGDEFEISESRTISVKGKGDLTTHFLLRPNVAEDRTINVMARRSRAGATTRATPIDSGSVTLNDPPAGVARETTLGDRLLRGIKIVCTPTDAVARETTLGDRLLRGAGRQGRCVVPEYIFRTRCRENVRCTDAKKRNLLL